MTPEEIIAGRLLEEFSAGPVHREARAITAALTEAGYAIVPVEPTEEMVMSGERAYVLTGELSSVYPAMISAVEKG